MYGKRIKRWLMWCGVGVSVLVQFQGCVFQDPDIALRAGITLGTDTAIFLLENLAAGL